MSVPPLVGDINEAFMPSTEIDILPDAALYCEPPSAARTEAVAVPEQVLPEQSHDNVAAGTVTDEDNT